MSGRRRTREEVSLGLLGEMMVGMLPGDLAFTVLVPSEAAFESILKLKVTDSLVKDKINNTYAVLSRVMGFSAVPQHLPFAAVLLPSLPKIADCYCHQCVVAAKEITVAVDAEEDADLLRCCAVAGDATNEGVVKANKQKKKKRKKMIVICKR